MPIPINPKLTKYVELLKIIKEEFNNDSKKIIQEDVLRVAMNILNDVKEVYGKLDFSDSVNIGKKLYKENPSKYNKSEKIMIKLRLWLNSAISFNALIEFVKVLLSSEYSTKCFSNSAYKYRKCAGEDLACVCKSKFSVNKDTPTASRCFLNNSIKEAAA